MKNNIPLRLSFLYIGFCFFAALFTYFLIPDKTTHANSMNLRIQSEKPGFKTKIIKVPVKDYKKRALEGTLMGDNVYCDTKIEESTLQVKGDISVFGNNWFDTRDRVKKNETNEFYIQGRLI